MANPRYFKNVKEWHSWLEKNHDKEKEIWVIFYKKHTGKKGISYQEAVDEAICFGWIDGKLKRINNEKHKIRFSPRGEKSVWSKINKDKAEKLIKEGRMKDAGYKMIEKAKKAGLWQKAYTNKNLEKMPSDLKKALNKNKTALKNFNKFSNSYKNMFIGWVINAKKDDTRKRRIQQVLKKSEKNMKL